MKARGERERESKLGSAIHIGGRRCNRGGRKMLYLSFPLSLPRWFVITPANSRDCKSRSSFEKSTKAHLVGGARRRRRTSENNKVKKRSESPRKKNFLFLISSVFLFFFLTGRVVLSPPFFGSLRKESPPRRALEAYLFIGLGEITERAETSYSFESFYLAHHAKSGLLSWVFPLFFSPSAAIKIPVKETISRPREGGM